RALGDRRAHRQQDALYAAAELPAALSGADPDGHHEQAVAARHRAGRTAAHASVLAHARARAIDSAAAHPQRLDCRTVDEGIRGTPPAHSQARGAERDRGAYREAEPAVSLLRGAGTSADSDGAG